MPRSDTWPGGGGGGGGMDTMAGMESPGSWDSVVSGNSGFSDDSMDYLSAEERACLMFLEETIDSLDTEEDSGLSNDEPDQPLPGNLSTKMAKLSASMSTRRLNGAQQHDSKKPFTNIMEDHQPVRSYLVPTPLLVASSATYGLPERKTGSPSRSQTNDQPQPQPWQAPPQAPPHVPPHVPSEVNVVVIPPPTKPKSYLGQTGEAPPSRGPLSYEALVHVRRSASAKKSPLCPLVDHTIDGVQQNHRNLTRAPSGASAHDEALGRPAAAHKPSNGALNAPSTPSKGPAPPASPAASSSAGKRFADPQKIRKEALQKLGLLQEDREPRSGPTKSLSHSQSQTALDLLSKRAARASASGDPSGRVPKESQGRPVQSSASFHDVSPRRGQNFLSDPSDPNVQHPEPNPRVENQRPSLSRSVSMGVQNGTGDGHEQYHHTAVHGKAPEPVRRTATAGARPAARPGARPAAGPAAGPAARSRAGPAARPRAGPAARSSTQERSAAVGFSVALLPGMGADRREALRKLGLLKD